MKGLRTRLFGAMVVMALGIGAAVFVGNTMMKNAPVIVFGVQWLHIDYEKTERPPYPTKVFWSAGCTLGNPCYKGEASTFDLEWSREIPVADLHTGDILTVTGAAKPGTRMACSILAYGLRVARMPDTVPATGYMTPKGGIITCTGALPPPPGP